MNLTRRYALAAAAAIFLATLPVPSSAQTIINEWSSIKTPAAPELKSVTIDPKTTALLLLDFVRQTCNEKVRPRCLATLPAASGTEARKGPKNRPMKMLGTPHFFTKASPRGSIAG